MKDYYRGIGMTSDRTRDRLIKRIKEQGVQNTVVLDAIRGIPRHIFVDEALASRAYEDTALPIGYSQTISQPYIVARMTELLIGNSKLPFKKVLEIGTGSGYQAAILSQITTWVYSIERINVLQQQAKQKFKALGIKNIVTQHSDGSLGWEYKSPFDAIMVTAAPNALPKMLLDQLKVGGSMVIPVGLGGSQALMLIVKTSTGFEKQVLDRVSFVPLLEDCM